MTFSQPENPSRAYRISAEAALQSSPLHPPRRMTMCGCGKQIKRSDCQNMACRVCCGASGHICSKHKVKIYNEKKFENLTSFYRNDTEFKKKLVGGRYRARLQSRFEFGTFVTASIDGINLNGIIFDGMDCKEVRPQNKTEIESFVDVFERK